MSAIGPDAPQSRTTTMSSSPENDPMVADSASGNAGSIHVNGPTPTPLISGTTIGEDEVTVELSVAVPDWSVRLPYASTVSTCTSVATPSHAQGASTVRSSSVVGPGLTTI